MQRLDGAVIIGAILTVAHEPEVTGDALRMRAGLVSEQWVRTKCSGTNIYQSASECCKMLHRIKEWRNHGCQTRTKAVRQAARNARLSQPVP